MNKYLRKIYKLLKVSISALLLLFLAVWLLIQIPKVQNWLVQKVTASLSETLQTKVKLERVNLHFFKTAVLEGLHIEDQQSDTLLFAKKLKADIGIFSLFQKELFINKVQLEGAVVNLSAKQPDSLFNFQFIIDAFSGNEPKAKKKNDSSDTWTFGVGKVVIEDSRFNMSDENKGGFELKTEVGSIVIEAEALDFKNKKIALSDLYLENTSVDFTLSKNDSIVVSETSTLIFPGFGWEIIANELELKDTRFAFSNLNYERKVDIVDYNYLGLEDISLNISDLSMTDTSIYANIQQVSVLDHSGFQILNLSTEIGLNNEKIAANKVIIETPFTTLKTDVSLSFNTFGDLTDFMNKVKLEATFGATKIAYRDLTKLVPALINLSVLNTTIDEKISLNGKIILEKNNIFFKNFDSKIGKIFALQTNGSILQLTNDPIFDINIKKLITDRESFIRLTEKIDLPEGLAKLGNIDFSGHIKGTISDLNGKNLDLITHSGTTFKGDLSMLGLPDIEQTIFTANVEELITHTNDIEAFAGTQFPGIFDSLGLINFDGHFEGTIYDFLIKGAFQTDAGNFATNIKMDFDHDYQNARYNGIIETVDFDLSKILEGPYGLTSFTLDTEGSGLNVNDLNIDLNGSISTFSYRDYTYQNLSLTGDFYKQRFEGVASAEDENLHFDFQGMIDMNDSLPDIQMALNVDTVNLKILNFMDEDLAFSGKLETNLKGNKLDNISGNASLQNLNITKDSISYSANEMMTLESFAPAVNQKALYLRSEFMDISFDGKFNIEELPKSIIEFVDDLFSIEAFVSEDSSYHKSNQIEEQDVVFSFLFKNVVPLARVFLPELTEADTAFIEGNFNSNEKHLSLEGVFPNLTYGNFGTDTVHIISNGTSKDLESSITVKHTQFGDAVNLPLIQSHTLFTNNSLNFGLNILGNGIDSLLTLEDTILIKNDTKLDLKGNISIANKIYTLSFFPGFVLNNDQWKIAPANKIEYKNKHLSIDDFSFVRGKQKLNINSRGAIPENDFQPIEISFSHFNLEELSNMLGMKENKFGGWINGDLVIKEPKTNLYINSEILIDSLAYNDDLVGNLNINAKRSKVKSLLELAVRLDGAHQMAIDGDYEIKERIFDLDFQFGSLPLFLIDLFLKGIVQESDGYLSGQMKLKGTPEHPDLTGSLQLKDASSTAVISNMKYRFGETTIQISENVIDLGTIQLEDANDNTAVLNGRIFHNYFDDINFDLNFDTDAFQFLKTTVAENELYFGNLFLKASVAITGTTKLPKLAIDASTLPKTHLFVQPFSGEKAIKQENYIIFGNPEFYNEDSLILVEKLIQKTKSPFELSLKLQVTKDARLNVIIDPSTGDQLICNGTANLNLNIKPSGEMTVVGNYVIDKGSYSLNYEQLVKREFEIVKGSSIIFSGDVMNAAFDVTASYKVRASTYELLANESLLSETEKQSSSQRIDVVVLMFLKGNINEPRITFDIQIPDTQGEGVTSAINRKLVELRNNPEELNKQAFGLLLFKSFISDDGSANADLSTAGTNIALSSVSNLLTDQLNRFADRYAKGFEIDVGVESFTSGANANAVTQMQLNISKKLLEDRLTINVGTNVNLNAENASSIFQSNFSGIAGDFVLEYKLTESGTYNIKVFHENDYNALEQTNISKTGAGIIFRKSFNGKKYKE